MFEISSQKVLCVRIAWLQRYDRCQKICGLLHPVVLPLCECQKIECARKIGLQAQRRFQLLSGFVISTSFKKEPAQVVVHFGRRWIKARGLLKFIESTRAVILIDETDAQVQVLLRTTRLHHTNFPETRPA